jgi:trans-L-3-hydroxyproline dehydratase
VVEVPGIGRVGFDVAFGGAFYALVESDRLGLSLDSSDYSRIIDYGRRIKVAVMENFSIEHPFEPDLGFLYGTIFTGSPSDPANWSRNVCVFADGEVDRSPTGSGVSARAALHYERRELGIAEKVTIESIIGTTMGLEITEAVDFGGYRAVIPEVSGTASFSGRNSLWIDPDDDLKHGFILR